jgi:tetraprenyl-beta-curcumene synthase
MQTWFCRTVAARGCDTVAMLASLYRYWLRILPVARREIRRWKARAGAIPDVTLRTYALDTLRTEAMNAEAAAVFATLVPRRHRADAIRLLVAFQVMYDYLDTVGEEEVCDPLRHGFQLHRALSSALDPAAPPVDYYRYRAACDDGGYLDNLVAACRGHLAALPTLDAVLPVARRAARRCGDGQSYTHAAIRDGPGRLAAWATRQERSTGFLWWELAAGAISSVGLYALLAAAADPRTTTAQAELIDAAYFPPICALSALLDSLIDRARDVESRDHNTFRHYPTAELATERLTVIAGRADEAVGHLRYGRRHVAILAGVVGYYLSAAGDSTQHARRIAAALTGRLGANVPIVLATMKLRRRLGHRGVS